VPYGRFEHLLTSAEPDAGISGIVPFWLDEEWTPLAAHKVLGEAAARAYTEARQEGAEDMSDVVLTMSNKLMAFDFHDTFVNSFDVSNKVVELLMMRAGVDVCCTSEDDQTLIARYEATKR
jgi:hypothetical protein